MRSTPDLQLDRRTRTRRRGRLVAGIDLVCPFEMGSLSLAVFTTGVTGGGGGGMEG
jgi:hypothetical protein